MKPLSRTPFVLMLQDVSGELSHIKLDPNMVNSDTAIIVLDEYQDTCWVWVGRDVGMPTRMHALRMSKSVQKSGYVVDATTIGRSLSNLIEMLEKNDGDPDVAANIASFREMLGRKWSFDNGILAYDSRKATKYEAQALEPIAGAPTAPTITEPEPTPAQERKPVELVAESVEPESKKVESKAAKPTINAEKKAAMLLYSAVQHADVVYVEKIERDGAKGLRVEAPGVLVVEALFNGDNVSVSPEKFGDNKQASQIKTEYEKWLNKI